ncbi:hypothetical protein MDA_GLEAN10012451 [Myotis davidii]|uniref:Uncharacterized protein n=1 Tax=Myotis davidii TaxID=225400 RepID=L5LCE9_MYODS|nr:hypothetical protein MDA_GLEAN10012451 [Myotis davidii]
MAIYKEMAPQTCRADKATLSFPKWDTGPATTLEQQPTKSQPTLPRLHGAKCSPQPSPSQRRNGGYGQRGGREKESERNINDERESLIGCFLQVPYWEWSQQHRHVPLTGIKSGTLPTEPSRLGLFL